MLPFIHVYQLVHHDCSLRLLAMIIRLQCLGPLDLDAGIEA